MKVRLAIRNRRSDTLLVKTPRPIDLVPENLASVRQIAHVVVRRLAARH